MSFLESDLAGADLSEADLTGADLRHANLLGANLTRRRPDRRQFSGGMAGRRESFRSADFPDAFRQSQSSRGSRSLEARVHGASFANAILAGAHFNHCSISDSNFAGADLAGARFMRARLQTCRFNLATADSADFSSAIAQDNDFSGAHLNSAKFFRAGLTRCHFIRASLTGCNFQEADLSFADFSGASLANSRFAGGEFVGREYDERQTARRAGTDGATAYDRPDRGGNAAAEWRTGAIPKRLRRRTAEAVTRHSLRGASFCGLYLAAIGSPFAPFSLRITISTRRFRARPSAVSLEAMAIVSA